MQLRFGVGEEVHSVGVDDKYDHIATPRVSPPLGSILGLSSEVPALHLHAPALHHLDVQPDGRSRLHRSAAT